jgi:type I restriction enzyme S subunit
MSAKVMKVEEPSARYLAKAEASDVPPGYRRTEAGVIPEDWSISSVGAEFTVQLGKMLDAARNVGTPKPYIGNRSVQWGWFDLEGIAEVPMTPSDLHRFRLRRNDLLVCEGGEIGRAAIWDEPIPECYYQKALHRLRPKGEYDAYLMMSFLQLWASSGNLANFVTQTSIAHLPKDKLETVPLPVPPSTEQRVIAEALSDVDRLLAALEALVAKRRAIKLAAMQQLLTGKTRLPQFSGEWETKRLGDHVRFLRHGVNSRAELRTDGGVKYLHYGDIHTSADVYLDPRASPMPRLSTDRARTLDRLEDGDLVLVDASEDVEGVGKSVELKGAQGEEVVSGLHTIAARFDKAVLADGFKAYLQFCPVFRDHVKRLAAGTKVYATNRTHIASVEMPLPRVNEQIAIAGVLSDMDAEISTLEARRDKTRALKRGMMQQLLTGRVRLMKRAVGDASGNGREP